MDKLMDIAETAEALGLSVPGVYGLVFRKRIPVIKISRRCLRFREEDVKAWIESKKQDVRAEILPILPTRENKPTQKKGAGKAAQAHIDRLVENAKKGVHR